MSTGFIIDRLRIIFTNLKSKQTCPEQSGSYFIWEIDFALSEVHAINYVGLSKVHALLFGVEVRRKWPLLTELFSLLLLSYPLLTFLLEGGVLGF